MCDASVFFTPHSRYCVREREKATGECFEHETKRCGGLAEQKDILLSYTSRKARRPGQVAKIKALHALIPDYTEKDVHYSYLMKCYGVDNDLSSAKALFDQMEAEGVSVHELSLKRLAVLYRNAGEALPFPEPPESFKFYSDKLRESVSQSQE